MELLIDHVMFPVYLSNEFLDVVEKDWKRRNVGRVFSQAANPSFKPIYFQSKRFYVEYLSNVSSEPYWSNAVYVVVPTELWGYYKNPVIRNEYFLVPSFGCGYQLINPEFPHLNSLIAEDKGVNYNGFELLVSAQLHETLLNIAGEKWSLPDWVQIHDKLMHVHDIAVVDEQSKLVAPILQPNPILREFL